MAPGKSTRTTPRSASDGALPEMAALRGPEEVLARRGRDGLLVYRDEDIDFVNDDPDWLFTTLPNKVRVGRKTVAAFRIGPLMVREKRLRVERHRASFGASVAPFETALVTTGASYTRNRQGRVPTQAEEKLAGYGGEFRRPSRPGRPFSHPGGDLRLADEGAELVLCTGGMSVDADDMTPSAIRAVCDSVLFRRTPVIPGQFMLAVMAARLSSAFRHRLCS